MSDPYLSRQRQARVLVDPTTALDGFLNIPAQAIGVVAFAHGSGSSRYSPRNQFVARALFDAGLATLLFDLLTPEEEYDDARTREHRFDIPLLARRLAGAVDWLQNQRGTRDLPVGLYGSSTGAAAALMAAAEKPRQVGAVVARGGRPDLADEMLPFVYAPTLFIVGGQDTQVLALNRQAMARMAESDTQLEIVPGASHLFQELGTLERASELAVRWFVRHLSMQG